MLGARPELCGGGSLQVLPCPLPGVPQPGGEGGDGALPGGEVAGLGREDDLRLCEDSPHLHQEVAVLRCHTV